MADRSGEPGSPHTTGSRSNPLSGSASPAALRFWRATAQKLVLATGLVGIGSFLLIAYLINHSPLEQSLERGVEELVRQHPELRPQWKRAKADGVLTMSEANALIEAAQSPPDVSPAPPTVTSSPNDTPPNHSAVDTSGR